MTRVFRFTSLATGAALVLATVLATAVAAQGPGPGRMGRSGGPGGPGGRGGPGVAGLPLGQLDLTEAQRTQIRDVMTRHQADGRAAADKLRQAREVQREASQAVPLNEGAIRMAASAVADAEADAAIVQARIHNEVFALLTSEQQAKAKQIADQREARMEQRRKQMEERLRQRQAQ
ncbi:MAG: periplasmic heavy metal sensor [Acidimicrobiia bacterium]|nr:periplasmic heavy metal sensor [Acidimicrobiia bacterium]